MTTKSSTFDQYDLARSILEHASDRWDSAKADFLEGFDENPSYTIEWKTEAVVKATAEYALARELLGDDPESEWSFNERLDNWMHSFERSLGYDIRGNSWSTSTSSNLVEQISFKVKAEFYAKVKEAERYNNS